MNLITQEHPQDHCEWLQDERDAMVGRLRLLSEINSGSHNISGLEVVKQHLSELFAPLGGQMEHLPLPALQSIDDRGEPFQQSLGEALRIRKRPQAPLRVFLGGHMDTVFGPEHSFQKVRDLDAHTLNGPGVADLKGGLLVMLNALTCLERSPWADAIGWEVLINPDEEIGSPGSAGLLEEAAARNDLGLIFEPALPDGSCAGDRKGTGNFSVLFRGRAAHAGREHHLGRNAIRAQADFVCALDDLNGRRDGVTINPGYVSGGGALNIVPDLSVFRFNVRLARVEDEAWFLDELEGIRRQVSMADGISVELHGGISRKPKIRDQAGRHLCDLVDQCGTTLGLGDFGWAPTGGCCDGNNLAAAGLANVDTLGVVGGNIHSSQEYAITDSLTERSRLSALLLLRLACGEASWPWRHHR